MDLQSTLIRAESLFRRFERTVETIDRKETFPAPKSQRKEPSSPTAAAGPSSPRSPRSPPGQDQRRRSQDGKRASTGSPKEKVISPELRGLLSRKVVKLPKEEVIKRGGGV